MSRSRSRFKQTRTPTAIFIKPISKYAMFDATAISGDEIAACVLDTFRKLPAKRKPLQRPNGSREWVPLSGVVLAKGSRPSIRFHFFLTEIFHRWKASLLRFTGVNSMVMSIVIFNLTISRTGMKCLPASKVPQAQGIVLHDCHAEIIATRAFNRFLIQECAVLAQDDRAKSQWVRRATVEERGETFQQPFALEDDVVIFFYSSEAPCGDASMELTMLAQVDATPWERAPDTTEPGLVCTDNALAGRGFFSELGRVRRKPGIANLLFVQIGLRTH